MLAIVLAGATALMTARAGADEEADRGREIAERWEIETEIATHYGEAGWCAAFLRALDEALHGNAESQAEKRFFGAVDSHDSVHYAGDHDGPDYDRYDGPW